MKRSLARLFPGSEFPYLSMLMTTFALILFTFNDPGSSLQYDRTAIASGELWRIITGHWVHWSFDHFLWCVITFVALGAICERQNRPGFILSVSLSAIIIPVICWFADPAMHFYRGLSGLCSTIFVVAFIQMVQKAVSDKDLLGVILPTLAGCFFIAKTLFEFITGQALFVQSTTLFTPVPVAHLAGALAGVIIAIVTGGGKGMKRTSQDRIADNLRKHIVLRL